MKNLKMKYLIPGLLFFMNWHVNAQNKSSVYGIVVDKNNVPIEFANVIAKKISDSVIVKLQVTNNKGEFSLEDINADTFNITVSHLSYTSWSSTNISKDQLPLNLKTIVLEDSNFSLDEVTIIVEKPLMELHPDKVVINVKSSNQFSGENTFEIMEKLPGLSVNVLSGSINIQGKQGSSVFINGRKTNLSTEDIATLLRSTAAEQVERVEIITNPSAKYDASGNAGIINIVLAKNEQEGLNGSFRINLQQGIYFKYGAGLSLNFRKERWNVYGSYNIQDRKDFTDIMYEQEFQSTEPPTRSVQESNRVFNVVPQNFNVGIDFNAKRNVDINFLFQGSKTKFDSPQKNRNTFSDFQGSILESALTTSQVMNKNDNYSINLNVNKTDTINNISYNMNADYVNYDRENDQVFETVFFDENDNETGEITALRGRIPSMIDIWSLTSDVVKTFEAKKLTLETGVKWSNVVNDNFPQFFDIDNGSENPNIDLTNHFVYEESIFAVYADVSKEFEKSTLKIGLRGENTKGIGDQKINNEVFNRSYFGLFPTLFYKNDVSENHSLSVALGRRIDRPSYNDLNPYRLFLDQFTLWQGNPLLGPQFTYNFELAHQYKRRTITKLSYTRTSDVISSVVFQDNESQVTTETKRNLNTFSQLNLSVSTSFKPYKWWNSSVSASIFNNVYEGLYLEDKFKLEGIGFIISNYNNFSISDQIKGNINGSYDSSYINGIEEMLSNFNVNAGVTRTSRDKKTNVRLSLSDIFNTRRGGGTAQLANLNRSSLVNYDSRVLRFSFTYNFGRNTIPEAKRRDSGPEEEQNRTY